MHCKKLTKLSLAQTGVTDDTLRTIRGSKLRLQALSVSPLLSQDGFQELLHSESAQTLQKLDISGCPHVVKPASVPLVLSSMPSLAELCLKRLKVGHRDADAIREKGYSSHHSGVVTRFRAAGA